MSHLLYGIFQCFSTQNDVVYFSIFLGDTWRVWEGAHATVTSDDPTLYSLAYSFLPVQTVLGHSCIMLSMYLYASKAYEGPLGAPSGESSQEYTTEVESI